MSGKSEIGVTKSVTVTVLVDNWVEMARSTERVRRFTEAPLLAEHGFSALVELGEGEKRVLWDAGATRIALTENMRRMEINPSTIDVLALSHGHYDHVGGVTEVVRSGARRPQARRWEADAQPEDLAAAAEVDRMPIVAHPAAFRERWNVGEDGARYGPTSPPPRAEWEALGARVVLAEGPYKLAEGCCTTGTVPRRSFEGAGRSKRRQYRVGTSFLPDDLEDDQAMVIHVQGKGLVVLAGCAHSGIINTVRYACELAGEPHVIGVLGGFHLFTAGDDEIDRTIDEMERIAPDLVSPSHCAGARAVRRFAERMPDQFVQGGVGTSFLF